MMSEFLAPVAYSAAAAAATFVAAAGAVLLRARKASGEEARAAGERLAGADAALAAEVCDPADFAPRRAAEYVAAQSEELSVALGAERRELALVEDKLELAQKEVETKEAAQQDVKASKEEDETKLAALLAAYADVSNESVLLEQNLASSLKHLDAMLGELELSEAQRSVLTELSEALVASGARLRDLITEYAAVNQRLESLSAQHRDLDDEYTKLVEAQLGG